MAFNDFLKKAKEAAETAANTAKSAAEAAKAKYDEKMQQMEAEKAERERIKAENQAKTDAETQNIINAINANSGNAFAMDSKQLLDFTADFYDKLYLPAHSVSSSKWVMHPLDKKIDKYVTKEFTTYDVTNEKPVFIILGKEHQKVFLSTKALYFKKIFPEANGFFCIGSIPIENIASLEYIKDEYNYIFKCNGVELMNSTTGFDLDIEAFNEYFKRIQTNQFEITEEQIDTLIKTKIGSKILEIVKQYIYDDELILYFAWGGDSITAKDFIVCSNKQMVVLDRELIGLTKNVKQFYYEDVTSMATVQETTGLLDLALTAAFSLCDLEISVAGAKETIRTLFTYEAEKVVKVYRDCRRNIKEGSKQPQVIVQQAAQAEDPLAQLEKLSKLKDMGIISEEEYNAKKADLLAKL